MLTCAVLTVAVATPGLVVAASGQAALESTLAAAPQAVTDPASAGVVAVLPFVEPALDATDEAFPDPAIVEAVSDRLDALPGYTEPVRVTYSIRQFTHPTPAEAVRPIVAHDGAAATATLFHQAGAIEGLRVVAGPDPAGGVWLPAGVADQIGAGPGDSIDVGFELRSDGSPAGGTQVSVAGVYATDNGRPTGPLRSPSTRLPTDPDDRSMPAPLVLVEIQDMQQLAVEIGDVQFDSVQAAVANPPRIEQLRDAASGIEGLATDAFDVSTDLGAAIFRQYEGPVLQVDSELPAMVEAALAVASAVAARISAATVAATVLALGAVAATVGSALRRRSSVIDLELLHGVRPVEVALRSTVEALPPIAVGAVLGRALLPPPGARVLPGAQLPAPALEVLTSRAVMAVALAAGATFLTVLLFAAAAARRAAGVRTGRRPPVLAMLVAATLVAAAGTVLAPAAAAGGPLGVVLPVLALCTLAVWVARVGGAFRALSTAPRLGPNARWLAWRRMSGGAGRLLSVVVIGVVAVGMLSHAAIMRASVARAVDDKAIASAGAQSVVATPTGVLPRLELLPQPVPGTTSVVLRDRGVTLGPDDTQVSMLAIDSETFAAAAAWPSTVDPAVLNGLDRRDGLSVPVVVVAGEGVVPDTGSIQRGGTWSAPFEVVQRPPTFPGATPGMVTIVASQSALFDRLDPALDPRSPDPLDVPLTWRSELWSNASPRAVTEALRSPTGDPFPLADVVRTLRSTRAEPDAVAVGWANNLLAGLAFVIAVIAGIVVLATRPRDRSDAALEYAMLRRFGMPSAAQLRAALLERVGVVLVTAAVGAVAGIAIAVWLVPRSDPAPELSPALTITVPVAAIVAVIAWLAAAAAASALLDHHAAKHGDVEEALRVTR